MSVASSPEEWAILRASYERYGLALCLGAGVSQLSLIPSWLQLLERLAVELLAPSERSSLQLANRETTCPLVHGLLEIGFSLPAIASLLQNRARTSGSNAQFLATVRRSLYSDLYEKFPGLSKKSDEARKYLGKWISTNNPTLSATAAFCVRMGPEMRVVSNPRVPAIVNLNFDGLFRFYARSRYKGPLFRTIERANKSVTFGSTRYYHPHGYLPIHAEDDHSEDLVVFTEQDYYEFFNRPTGVFTYTLLSVLREYPVLFIGLSFQDENLRRLLHFSVTERYQHAQFEKESASFAKCVRHFAIFRRREPQLDRLLQESLYRLGVQLIWIDSFDELPKLLGFIYGADWNSVFRLSE